MTTVCWAQVKSEGGNSSEDRTFPTCSTSTLFIWGMNVVGEWTGLVRDHVESNGFFCWVYASTISNCALQHTAFWENTF